MEYGKDYFFGYCGTFYGDFDKFLKDYGIYNNCISKTINMAGGTKPPKKKKNKPK